MGGVETTTRHRRFLSVVPQHQGPATQRCPWTGADPAPCWKVWSANQTLWGSLRLSYAQVGWCRVCRRWTVPVLSRPLVCRSGQRCV